MRIALLLLVLLSVALQSFRESLSLDAPLLELSLGLFQVLALAEVSTRDAISRGTSVPLHARWLLVLFPYVAVPVTVLRSRRWIGALLLLALVGAWIASAFVGWLSAVYLAELHQG